MIKPTRNPGFEARSHSRRTSPTPLWAPPFPPQDPRSREDRPEVHGGWGLWRRQGQRWGQTWPRLCSPRGLPGVRLSQTLLPAGPPAAQRSDRLASHTPVLLGRLLRRTPRPPNAGQGSTLLMDTRARGTQSREQRPARSGGPGLPTRTSRGGVGCFLCQQRGPESDESGGKQGPRAQPRGLREDIRAVRHGATSASWSTPLTRERHVESPPSKSDVTSLNTCRSAGGGQGVQGRPPRGGSLLRPAEGPGPC